MQFEPVKRRFTGSISCFEAVICLFFIAGCAVHPKALNPNKSMAQANAVRDLLIQDQEPVTGTVSLEEAMARAVKYNRERHVRLMKSALALTRVDKSTFDMLPELTVSAGYSDRDNTLASSSESVETGRISLEPSTSSDKDRKYADVSFAWNILDFGLSYVRAGQMANRYLIAREMERKAIQTLIADVRQAWWEALAAQRVVDRIAPLEEKVTDALDMAREVEERRLQEPIKALTYQRDMLNMMQTLEGLRTQLTGAKSKLAALMGLRPGTEYTLRDPGEQKLLSVDLDIQSFELKALANRPEIKEAFYEERISESDARVALLQLLPGISLNAGFHWDSNSFLVNESWFDYGAQVGWNLFNVFRYPKDMAMAKARREVTRAQRLAISMSVLMQVHLARVQMLRASRKFQLAREYLQVEERILNQLESANTTKLKGEQELIREELNHLLAMVRKDLAWAEVQDSYGRLDASIGLDPLPEKIDSLAVADLAAALRDNMQNWTADRSTMNKP